MTRPQPCELLLVAALLLGALTDSSAAPPHVNLTQGEPWTGCSKRVESLKPSAVPFGTQNQPDPNKSYVLRAARILEPRTGAVTTNGYLLIKGECIVGINAAVPPGAETVDLGKVTLLPGLIDLHTHMLLRDDPRATPFAPPGS